MYTATKTVVARHNNSYYKLVEGQEIPKMPDGLIDALLENNYIKGNVIKKETKPKKRSKKVKKEDEIIPEEDINLMEVYDKDIRLEIPEEEHIINKEGIF